MSIFAIICYWIAAAGGASHERLADPELEKLVADKVAAGLYASASEVVRDALRLLEERDTLRQAKLDAMKRRSERHRRLGSRKVVEVADERELRALVEGVRAEGRKKLPLVNARLARRDAA